MQQQPGGEVEAGNQRAGVDELQIELTAGRRGVDAVAAENRFAVRAQCDGDAQCGLGLPGAQGLAEQNANAVARGQQAVAHRADGERAGAHPAPIGKNAVAGLAHFGRGQGRRADQIDAAAKRHTAAAKRERATDSGEAGGGAGAGGKGAAALAAELGGGFGQQPGIDAQAAAGAETVADSGLGQTGRAAAVLGKDVPGFAAEQADAERGRIANGAVKAEPVAAPGKP